jgi:hypothetical protein
MSWVHVHLLTNHIPVIGVIIGLILLIVGMAWKSRDLERLMLYYFVVLGAISLLVFLTGEPAEKAIEHTVGVSEALIERHEEASVFGLITVEVVAAMSLIGIWLKRKNLIAQEWYMRVLLLLVVVASGTMGWVANLGGKIRHTEMNEKQSAEISGEENKE